MLSSTKEEMMFVPGIFRKILAHAITASLIIVCSTFLLLQNVSYAQKTDDSATAPSTKSKSSLPPDVEFCATDEPCRILPLGDSITFGIGFGGGYRVELFSLAVKDGKNITFVGQNPESDRSNQPNGPQEVEGVSFPKYHLGTSGITIENLQKKVLPDRVLKAAPDGKAPNIVLLHIGTNDMWAGAQDADIRLGKLIDELTASLPKSLIVVSNIIPFPGSAAKVELYNSKIPATVEERAAKGKYVLFVDQFAGFPASELGDGVHPNKQGYSRMAKVWYDAISKYLKNIKK
jgi:lysophospholipase L1-like esterase